jgi:predicted MFS family arabinose efflux permease
MTHAPVTFEFMTPQKPIAIAVAGMLSLAVAMGIGRFAFTPLLPMMLHDDVISLGAASWLATANYLGYWLGAMACALQPLIWTRWPFLPPMVHTHAIRAGLLATVVLTLAMASHWPNAWPLWRFLAGVASALVFVYTSGWCMARLAALDSPKLAGLIFVGPGLGIMVSGLAASVMVASSMHAASAWVVFGALAILLTALLWPQLRGTVALTAAPPDLSTASRRSAMAVLALAYGMAGFGYIVTATFLPVIARQALPGSVWLDLFWPLFGLGVSVGALLTIRVPVQWDRRHLLMGCYTMQASGILLGVYWPSLMGFAFGSLLIGLPFTAITLFAIQEVRRLRPEGASGFIGLLTAVYGLGQIAGPPWVSVLLGHSANPAQGFALSLQTAAASLLLGVALYGWLAKRHPLTPSSART